MVDHCVDSCFWNYTPNEDLVNFDSSHVGYDILGDFLIETAPIDMIIDLSDYIIEKFDDEYQDYSDYDEATEILASDRCIGLAKILKTYAEVGNRVFVYIENTEKQPFKNSVDKFNRHEIL